MAAEGTTSKAFTTHHLIKVIALIVMTIDHIGTYIYPEAFWWRAIGRTTFPVWFFLIGHAPQGKLSKDIWIWAGVLALINPLLGGGLLPTNALVTLACCHYAIGLIEKCDLLNKEPWSLIIAAYILLLPTFVLMEYGTEGFLFALMGYAVRSGQMDWRRGKLVTVAALAMFLAMQMHAHPYDPAQLLFMMAGTTVITCYLARFEFRPIRSVPRFVTRPVLFLSRHSMQYYVVHRVILQAVGVTTGALNPAIRLMQ